MLTVLILTLGCAGQAEMAAAQDAPQLPDLKGRWVGTGESVVMGNPLHHGGDAASRDKPRLSAVEFTYTIKGQDGRRFWGTSTSQRNTEPIIGVIGFDGKTLTMQDSDGTIEGTIVDTDTIEFIYRIHLLPFDG
jgi:hypothetical protein